MVASFSCNICSCIFIAITKIYLLQSWRSTAQKNDLYIGAIMYLMFPFELVWILRCINALFCTFEFECSALYRDIISYVILVFIIKPQPVSVYSLSLSRFDVSSNICKIRFLCITSIWLDNELQDITYLGHPICQTIIFVLVRHGLTWFMDYECY